MIPASSYPHTHITPSTTAAPALPPLHPPPLPSAPYRLSPSSSTFLPTGQPLKEARGQAQPPAHAAPASPTPVQRAARSAILRPLRASMARVGVRIADLAVRRTGVGLAMAARAGGSARPRASSRGYPRGRRGEAVGEARKVARRRAAASLRTLPRTRSTGGELMRSARHLATIHRLPADRRTTHAPAAAPPVSAACLRACV